MLKWSQDASGTDRFESTDDVIFFPRILSVAPGEDRIVRIGLDAAPEAVERTYRIYLEELPEPSVAEEATVRTLMRVGIPLFLRPIDPQRSLEIEAVAVADGGVRVDLLNDGTEHVKIASIRVTGLDAAGETLLAEELNGWYLLAGVSRSHHVEAPADVLEKLERIRVSVETESGPVEREHPLGR